MLEKQGKRRLGNDKIIEHIGPMEGEEHGGAYRLPDPIVNDEVSTLSEAMGNISLVGDMEGCMASRGAVKSQMEFWSELRGV